MPTYTETSVLAELTIVPALDVINVTHVNTTFKDGVKFKEERSARSYSNLGQVAAEIAPTGASLLEIVQAFNATAQTQKTDALTAKATAEAALAQAITDKDAAVAAATAPLQAEIARLTALVPAPVTATGVVTMRQARLALLQVGKYADVSTAIASMPEPQKSAAVIEWEYGNTVERNSGLVPQLGALLGMTESQIDDLFALAATL
jgi:hypothetical protein